VFSKNSHPRGSADAEVQRLAKVSPNCLPEFLIVHVEGGRDRATQELIIQAHAWLGEPVQLSSEVPRNSRVNRKPWLARPRSGILHLSGDQPTESVRRAK
jgi:hypothetical protein